MALRRIEGSYRDPSGHVFDAGDHVLRSVRPPAVADFAEVLKTGFLNQLLDAGDLHPFEVADRALLAELEPDAVQVLRHPRLTFISHPYEWSFPALRAAALLHLDIQIRGLDAGVTLTDASAYNIQFVGPRPVFIDHLSFRPYRDGEFWSGHRQFCEQFLNPLLLTTLTGIPYQNWYRGSMDGLPAREIGPLLPRTTLLSRRFLLHVHLLGRLQGEGARQSAAQLSATAFPKHRYRKTLEDLRAWVSGLRPKGSRFSEWASYAGNTSYADAEGEAKRAFIREFISMSRPAQLWDIGCNTGDYSVVALEAGARSVIGFEFDHGALDLAYLRACEGHLALLPLHLDAANPSPDQGWAQRERAGLSSRRTADAVLALALVHHLAISRNVPLTEVVSWITGLAPRGVIEFVPKGDPMVQRLLSLRADVFEDYTEPVFLSALQRQARVVRTKQVTETGRLLAWFERG
jgi:ribosomal protein L11 methylase PrmA